MIGGRMSVFSLTTCTDCGGAVRDRDYYDSDNADNAAGISACDCRARRSAPPERYR